MKRLLAPLLLAPLLLANLAQAQPAPQPAPPRLTGIVVTPERRVAMFQDASGAIESAEEGTLAFGYLVQSIRADRAVLERDGRATMLVPTPLGGTSRLPPDTGGATFGLVVNPQLPAPD